MASSAFDDTNWSGYDDYVSDNTVIDNANDNLMINLGTHASADFWSNVASDGSDIRVTNSAGDTAYSFELENFDSTAETGILFFNSQGLSTSSDTTYRVYAGNGSASLPASSDTLGAENVWNNYALVMHMEDPSLDSSGNITPSDSGTTDDSGQMGRSRDFSDEIDHIDIDLLDVGSATDKSIQCWGNPTSLDPNSTSRAYFVDFENNTNRRIFSMGDDSTSGILSAYDGSSFIGFGPDTLTAGSWNKVTFAIDETNNDITAFLNGSSKGTENYTDTVFEDTGVGQNIGRRASDTDPETDDWVGDIDEFRISEFEITSDWESTEYSNQNDNGTFWTNNGWTALDVVQLSGSPQAQDATTDGILVFPLQISDSVDSQASTINANIGFALQLSGTPQAQDSTASSDLGPIVSLSGTPSSQDSTLDTNILVLITLSDTAQSQDASVTADLDDKRINVRSSIEREADSKSGESKLFPNRFESSDKRHQQVEDIREGMLSEHSMQFDEVTLTNPTKKVFFRRRIQEDERFQLHEIGFATDNDKLPDGLDYKVFDLTNDKNLLQGQNEVQQSGDPLVAKDGRFTVQIEVENNSGAERNVAGNASYSVVESSGKVSGLSQEEIEAEPITGGSETILSPIGGSAPIGDPIEEVEWTE